MNTALAAIIQRESSFKTTAQNPTSSAFGLCQMIAGNRRAYGARFGFDPATTDPDEQITMCKAYAIDRYGSYEAALEFWNQNHWW